MASSDSHSHTPSRSNSSASTSTSSSMAKPHRTRRSNQRRHHHRQTQTPPPFHTLTPILRLTSTTLSLTAIALLSAAIPDWNANFQHNSGLTRGDWTDGMLIAPLALSLLTNVFATSTTAPTNSRLPLLLDVLLTLSLLPLLTVATVGSLFAFWAPTVRSSPGAPVLCNAFNNVFAAECRPELYRIGRLQLGAVALGGLVCILHFSTFLLACVGRRRHIVYQDGQRRSFTSWYRRGGGGDGSYTWRIEGKAERYM